MDIKPADQQSISDDQELAKVLAGVNQQANVNPVINSVLTEPEATINNTTSDPVTNPTTTPVSPPSLANADSSLLEIKNDALKELRPLVDKLEVAPEEKFDTYLLLIRSTDDKSLIPAAYESAQSITDEARRAHALLDVIKEIDYLSSTKQ